MKQGENRLSVSYDGEWIYDIVLESSYGQLLDALAPVLKGRNEKNVKICIVTDSNVAKIHKNEVEEILKSGYSTVKTFVFESGEANKNLNTIEKLYEYLIINHFERNDLLIALGGGVVGDMTGFVAATFLRGIKFVQIPTSILAQVDSSVGGKVAVDLPQGKNLVGAFYQPKMVLIDPDVLETLPDRYVTDGMGEIIKYGCIKDRKLFDLLEKCGCYENLKEHLTDVIATCVDIKRRVVEEDEFDTGERILLNFGHTLAHTIEQHFHYERESHGEAVAIGMYQITKIAEEKGLTKKGEAEHIRKVLEAYKLPVKADVPLPQLTEAIKLDKKTLNNKLKVVLLHEIGDSYTYPTGQEFFDGDRTV